MTAYQKLEEKFKFLSVLDDISGTLSWDHAVMMPEGAAGRRGNQFALLGVLKNQTLTSAEIGDLIAEAEEDLSLSRDQQANLGEMKRLYTSETAVTPDLVEAMAKATTLGEPAWRKARESQNYETFRPHLDTILTLTREIAIAKGEKLNKTPLEALIHDFDPNRTTAEIDYVFEDYKAFLPDFLAQILEKQAREGDPLPLTGPFPIETQRELGLKLMSQLGFDFNRGRLDISTHPFCGGSTDDVRITTRYRTDSFRESLMGILHETGHALYEQGLPESWKDQPAGRARGMAMHESQSLFIEMQVCRGRSFITYLTPLLQQTFEGVGDAWSLDNLYKSTIHVSPSFIRVDADEVTYPAHVILRYELEKSLLNGDLSTKDLPTAWNDKMKTYLGIIPPNDSLGCLQDIHWATGGFGYFPTYTLGAMTAAQLYAAANKALPKLDQDLSQGSFTRLVSWLRTNVHEKASLYSTNDILLAATGQTLDATIFKNHLKNRYLERT